MTSEYRCELLIVEARLEKDPENEDLLELQRELKNLIELSEEIEADKEASLPSKDQSELNKTNDSKNDVHKPTTTTDNATTTTLGTSNSEAEKEAAKRKESKIRNNKKKKSKSREKMKEKLELAEQEKQNWQSFVTQRGLKGMSKKSIFASPISVAGKVGVGTNGIADAPAASSYARNRKFSTINNPKFIKMMGGYCYYTYTEDLGAEIHDCMWSGECYSCQANRTAIPIQTVSTTAITVGKSVGFTTLTSTAAVSQPDYARTFARINPRVPDSKPTKNAQHHQQVNNCNMSITNANYYTNNTSNSSTSTTSSSSNSNTSTNNSNESNISSHNNVRSSHVANQGNITGVTNNKRSHYQRQNREHNSYHHQHHQHQLLQHQYQQQQLNLHQHQTTSGSSISSVSSSTSSSENKKLRHREVEKNRHRQLQAMVRTLSDNIPGKLDKETQVQTMKRAARYCIYLREVLCLLSNPNETAQGANLRQKLDLLYLRSCENVELIMSSSANNN